MSISFRNTLPLWPLPLIAAGVLGSLNPVVIVVTAFVAVAPIAAVMAKMPKRVKFFDAPLVLFVISAFTGLWAAYNPALSIPLVVTIFGSGLLFFAIAYASRTVTKFVGQGLVIFSGLVALYFVTQYAHIGYPAETGIMADAARATTVLLPNLAFFVPHPNAVAGLISSTILLALVFCWQAGQSFSRAGWGMIMAIMFYALLVSGSRGAWVGLLIALGIWAVLYLPQWAQRMVGLAFGIGVGLLIGLYFLVQVASAAAQFFSPILATTASRLTLYHNSLNLYRDYLFTGIGPGDTFTMVYSQYQLLIDVPYLEYAHNIFLAVALGQGILGLVALIWLLLGFYWFVFIVEHKSVAVPLFRAAWLGVTVVFIHGFTDAPQFSAARWTMPALFVLLGIAAALGHPTLNRLGDALPGVVDALPARLKWGGLAAVIGALVIIGFIYRQPFMSAWYANLGALYQTHAALSPHPAGVQQAANKIQSEIYLYRALELNPTNATANLRLGLMALADEDFDSAITHLEPAQAQNPTNQATLKALAYAYLWTNQVDAAQQLFQQVTFRQQLRQELDYWQWQWGQNGKPLLSANAADMLQRLSAR